MFAILLALAVSDPAIAELPNPPDVVEVEWIEINQVFHSQGVTLQQVIIWRVWYDRHDRRWHYKPSWRNWSCVAAISTEDGIAVYDSYANRVWTAKRYLYTATEYDPERICRTDAEW